MTLIEFRYIAAQIWHKSFPCQRVIGALRQAACKVASSQYRSHINNHPGEVR